jgi:hypothetical protein
MVQVYNPNTQSAEKGGSWVQGQPRLHSETLSSKTKQKQIKRRTQMNNETKIWFFEKIDKIDNLLRSKRKTETETVETLKLIPQKCQVSLGIILKTYVLRNCKI